MNNAKQVHMCNSVGVTNKTLFRSKIITHFTEALEFRLKTRQYHFREATAGSKI